jgi:Family of unknown function (DUF6178)
MKEAEGRSKAIGAAGRMPETREPLPADATGRKSESPARRDTRGTPLLDRILDTPHLERVVPRLQPELLHKVIKTCGLEDCGGLVALTTPEQLTRIFDLDLWRSSRASRDEQFDPDRFGVWLEVLVESGAALAAQKLSEIDVDLVAAGFAQYVLVYDRGAASPYMTTDGIEMVPVSGLDDAVRCDIGGYLLVAKGSGATSSWDAIVTVLMALQGEHPDYFDEVMGGCRALSNPAPEIDGLDDLLGVGDQTMFDMAVDRERRQEKQGYVTPAQARAFLQMSRELPLGSSTSPPDNAIARAYFRGLDEPGLDEPFSELARSNPDEASEDSAEASTGVAEVIEILRDEGLLGQPPRALLTAGEGRSPRLACIQSHLEFLLDSNLAVYSLRNQELAYLANTIVSACSVQARPFTPQEASDAAVAVCNLGLENWPRHWIRDEASSNSSWRDAESSLPDDLLVRHDLVTAFQVGWAVLHRDVNMYAAERLIDVLNRVRCDDRETQRDLVKLGVEIAKHWRAGKPWAARDALDVITILDMPAWATLLALLDEFPVIHAGLDASLGSRVNAVGASDFEFISENSQLASIREFMQSLPEILAR